MGRSHDGVFLKTDRRVNSHRQLELTPDSGTSAPGHGSARTASIVRRPVVANASIGPPHDLAALRILSGSTSHRTTIEPSTRQSGRPERLVKVRSLYAVGSLEEREEIPGIAEDRADIPLLKWCGPFAADRDRR